MAVNQAGQNRRKGQIDHSGAGGMPRNHGGVSGVSYFLDPVAFDQDGLVGQHASISRVKKLPGLDQQG
jgi:hypothetical protein